jgi:beta-phosphoglucomutase-like phosphatase (HAD superfamily)
VESSQVGVESAAETGARVIAVPNNKTRNDDFSLSEYQIDSLEGVDVVDMLANVGFTIVLPIGEES